jgi:hypothetical protein
MLKNMKSYFLINLKRNISGFCAAVNIGSAPFTPLPPFQSITCHTERRNTKGSEATDNEMLAGESGGGSSTAKKAYA